MTELPKYSVQAKKNLSIFYSQYQEKHFYIEDKKNETQNAYRLLLSKLFKGKYEIKRVFSLENKDGVLRACRENTNPDNYYIVDRDLDPFLDDFEDLSSIYNNLIILERYCFENYLINENTFNDVLLFDLDESQILGEFRKWKESVYDDFIMLFKIALISRKYNLSSTITDKEYVYLINDSHLLDPEKIDKLFEKKKKELLDKDIDIMVELDEISPLITNDKQLFHTFISGKFLWASIKRYIKNLTKNLNAGKGINDKYLITNFIHCIDIESFEFIKKRVS
ncbi:hypothetical protein NYE53_09420 [Bacillus sp. FSL R5-0523]|uniref:hypothetical protein n=1 Tax=Bacillus sp. FSL R5-0523 TaxID=2975304 RepID=UPI0030D7AF40